MRKKTLIFACALLFAAIAQAQWTPEAGKRYLLKHVNSGNYLYLHDNYQETVAVNATSLRKVGTTFTVTKNGNNYTFTKAGTSKTLGLATGTWAAWNTSNKVATAWQIIDAGNGKKYIKSARGCLGPNQNASGVGAHIYTDKPQQQYTKWEIVDADAVSVVPTDGKIYALYNSYTNGDYPVTSAPGIATSTTATPQLYVFRSNGTDSKGSTLFRLQKADFDGKYLTWTNNSPSSVTHSTGTSNFLFLNNASTGYTWNTGTAPAAPDFNFVGFANNQYTIFGDKKSTTNTSFDGYSRRSATTLLNNAKCAKGANYSTTWKLVEQPYELYNVVITGYEGAGTPTVTYNNAWDNAIQRTPQKNGGGFLIGYDARNLSPAHFTAQEMDEHVSKVEISGKTITVTYRSTLNVTYIYKYGNTEWYRESKTVKPGVYPDLTLPTSPVKYQNVPIGRLTDDATVTINCELPASYPLIYSSNFNNAQWVYFSICDNKGKQYYLYYNPNTPNKLTATQTVPKNEAAYKWAFVGNPLTGFKVYNQAAEGKILSSTNPNGDGNTGGNTNIRLVEETNGSAPANFNTYWTINPSVLGFYMMRKGQSICANKRGDVLAFWNNGSDAGSRLFTSPVETLNPATALETANGQAVVGTKQYNIVNRFTGKAIGESSSQLSTAAPGNNDTQKWTLTASGNGFQIKNTAGNYMTGGPTDVVASSTGAVSTTATTMYLYAGEKVNGVQYYYINDAAAVTPTTDASRHFLGDDGGMVRSRGARAGQRVEWYLQEAVATATTQTTTVSYATSITSGGYYRLVNASHSGQFMTDNGGSVGIAGANGKYSQIWQITGSNGSYQLKNLLTGKTIQTWPGKSAQWKTGTSSAANFYSGTVQSNGNTAFWFAVANNTSENKSLHAAPHQSNTVVGWAASSDASKWLLEPVNVTTEMANAAADIQTLTNNDFTNQLTNFFTDYACTQLKSNYASMSDAQLRSAMSNLPKKLQDMAVSVKNNKWDATKSETWNYFEKGFRIHDYEVYSDRGAWNSKTGVAPYSLLTQPSGIKVKNGEPVIILVNDNATGNGVSLAAEFVSGMNVSGNRVSLKRGYNAILPNANGEIFIAYYTSDTEKLISEYPKIKIHIEGGTCNGAFDTSRGHSNNDWLWLTTNMFKDATLHVKSNGTMLNCNLSDVKNATKIKQALDVWDFIFNTEQQVMLGDRYEGKLKAMIMGNPANGYFWNGNSGYYTGLTGGGLLNVNGFVNGNLWVISHEEGHGHQGPINISGTREISNNALAQIVNFKWGRKTCRHKPQPNLGNYFNQGKGWVDLVSDETGALWLVNKMWFQLWLYFHLKGDDDFFPRWVHCIRDRGGLKTTNNANSPVPIANEYMRMALAACEASQTDLYEFFKAWGVFHFAEDIKKYDGNDLGRIHIKETLTNMNFYLKLPRKSVAADVNQMNAWKAEMQSYENKAPGIMFINDVAELTPIRSDAEVLKFAPNLAGQTIGYFDELAKTAAGCTGHYTHYGVNEANNLEFTLDGTKVTITGSGAVGYKIYDASGELVWISYWNSFNTNEAIAAGIANGTYSLVASLGDDTDLLLSGPGTMYTGAAHAKSIDEATGIRSIDNGRTTNGDWYTIDGVKLNGKPTEKGVYIVNGRKVVVK